MEPVQDGRCVVTAAETPAVSVRHLSKRYGRLLAVDDLSLDVRSGVIFGFLGLNGAGKTTTIRILLDLLRPTSGSAQIHGLDCQRRGLDVRAEVGYMPGELGFWNDMTGQALLDLLAGLGRRQVEPAYRRHLLDRLELSPGDLERRLREYSTGMKRKLGIIQALQGDPPLLILDEPTEGLDPVIQEAFYDVLFEVRQRGRTVFMSSHVLREVERVCDRIAVIRSGKLALAAPVDDVRRLAARRVRVVFDRDLSDPPPPLGDEFEVLEVQPRMWTLRAHGPLGPLVSRLWSLPVVDLEVQEPHLEDVLIRYYREGS
jgi:ABC-2 type transport system ATP-binding protein